MFRNIFLNGNILNKSMYNQLFLFHPHIEFVRRFLQILQISSSNKNSRKSVENVCDYYYRNQSLNKIIYFQL